MIDPIAFLLAAMLHHPAGPYLSAGIILGVGTLFGLPLLGREDIPPSGRAIPTRTRPASAPSTRPAKHPRAQIGTDPTGGHARPRPAHTHHPAPGFVPVTRLSGQMAEMLDRLEDVVERFGRAQRVLPRVPLGQVLHPAAPRASAAARLARRHLARAELDFGVFSYQGELELAILIDRRMQAPAPAQLRSQSQVAQILRSAGIPVIQLPSDPQLSGLRACLGTAIGHGDPSLRPSLPQVA